MFNIAKKKKKRMYSSLLKTQKLHYYDNKNTGYKITKQNQHNNQDKAGLYQT